MTDIFSLIDGYNDFSDFSIFILKYLSSSQPVLVSLFGILILYFGYYSNFYKPIRTQNLQLYLSGFQFISFYLIVQMIIVYFIAKYLPFLNLIYWLLLFILFISIFSILILKKIRFGKWTFFIYLFILIIFIKFVPNILWNYILQFEYVKWIVITLILYHATTVIKSCGFKELINQNSYDYKEFFEKTSKMGFYQYSIFSYFIRIAQEVWFTIFFGKTNKNKVEKKIPLEIASDIIKTIISERQFKSAGIELQKMMFQLETWFNSLIVLILMFIIFTYSDMSVTIGVLLLIYLFFALTSISIEYSIYNHGFLLIKIFLKNGESFNCRLMEMDGKLIKLLRRGRSENREFNPIEYYGINEVSKIRYISMGEMLDEF